MDLAFAGLAEAPNVLHALPGGPFVAAAFAEGWREIASRERRQQGGADLHTVQLIEAGGFAEGVHDATFRSKYFSSISTS